MAEMTRTLLKWEYKRQRRMGKGRMAAAWIALLWALEPLPF